MHQHENQDTKLAGWLAGWLAWRGCERVQVSISKLDMFTDY
jgi:hypothetical protein